MLGLQGEPLRSECSGVDQFMQQMCGQNSGEGQKIEEEFEVAGAQEVAPSPQNSVQHRGLLPLLIHLLRIVILVFLPVLSILLLFKSNKTTQISLIS